MTATGTFGTGHAAAVRDHLFISYAWEDGAVAEWLARKLTADGYRVWIDRFKLLGGEPWPQDIDEAIRTRTFRMLALLSEHSLAKPNPRKERQQALALSRARGERDFLIPLNVGGLSPSELSWELSDLTYVPFTRWAEGYAAVRAKLKSVGAPCAPGPHAAHAAAATYLPVDVLRDEPETLYANCLVVTSIPALVHRFTLERPLAAIEHDHLGRRWAYERLDDTRVVAFTDPPPDAVTACAITRKPGASWRDVRDIDGKRATHVVSSLVKKSLFVKCLERGLERAEDGHSVYFPAGLLPKDRIQYVNYKGRMTRIGVLGERRFGKHRSRFHLGAAFWVRSDVLPELVVELKIRLRLTDPSGLALDAKAMNARRKKIALSWWNHQWLSRQLAVTSFLVGDDADGQIVIGTVPVEQVRLAGRLLTATVRPSIDDAMLEPLRRSVSAQLLARGADEDDGADESAADRDDAARTAPSPPGPVGPSLAEASTHGTTHGTVHGA